jgi:hypothetical protein
MAALQSTTSAVRHVVGDMVMRNYTLSGTNADTFTVPGGETVIQALFTPTTAIAVGITRTFNVLTFVTLGAFAGRLTVYTKNG